MATIPITDPFQSLFNKKPGAYNTMPPLPKVDNSQGMSVSPSRQATSYLNGTIDPFKSSNNLLSNLGVVKPVNPAPVAGPVYNGPVSSKPTIPAVPQVADPNQGAVDFNKRIEANMAANNATPTTIPSAPVATTAEAETPTLPAVPQIQELSPEEKAVQEYLRVTPEELQTQEDIDRLIESTKAGYEKIKGQGEGNVTPLKFISGQLSAVERRATNLAEPLEAKLSRLQATRMANLDASKFALERSDKQAELAQSKDQLSYEKDLTERKFAEDIRQFNETNKLQKEELYNKLANSGIDVSSAQSWATLINNGQAEITDVPSDVRSSVASMIAQGNGVSLNDKAVAAMGNVNLVDDVLGDPNFNAVFGVKGITNYIPGTAAQIVKNKRDQIINLLSVDSREKLKGTGQISDFESKMLQRSATALGKNLSDKDAYAELLKIKEAFQRGALKQMGYNQDEIQSAIGSYGSVENFYNSAISGQIQSSASGDNLWNW